MCVTYCNVGGIETMHDSLFQLSYDRNKITDVEIRTDMASLFTN